MDDEIKLAFISEALNKYMREVIETMGKAIRRERAIETGNLLNSMTYNVYKQYAQGNAALSFAEWGRFLDMGVRRGHPLGGLNATNQALLTTAQLKKRKTRGKNPARRRQIYSPIAYGKLNGLIGRLAYGFTEETIQALKTKLQQHV